MRETLPTVARWLAEGQPVALATVVDVWRSAPRPAGAAMAVSGDGRISGSVSAGCVESAVVGLAQESLATGGGRVARFGVSDDEALAVGLVCGGEITVLVEAITEVASAAWQQVAASVRADEPVAAVAITDGAAPGHRLWVWPGEVAGSLGDPALDAAVIADVRAMLTTGTSSARQYGSRGERRAADLTVWVSALASRPRMVIFGATDFAAALAALGRHLGYHVTVCDARAALATPERFPAADEVVVQWPHRYLEHAALDERAVLCVLTHDPKFDVPLLERALRLPVAYVGAMGSRRAHAERLAGLRARGLDEEALGRLRSPIGLDLGGRTPEETAVAIAAEVIRSRYGGSAEPLRDTEGPIHAAPGSSR